MMVLASQGQSASALCPGCSNMNPKVKWGNYVKIFQDKN